MTDTSDSFHFLPWKGSQVAWGMEARPHAALGAGGLAGHVHGSVCWQVAFPNRCEKAECAARNQEPNCRQSPCPDEELMRAHSRGEDPDKAGS